ncbi:hypothetical protein D3C80_1158920 [compost metagenome]
MVPTVKKHLKFKSGAIGSSSLSVTFSQGMIASVGQTTDTKVPEMVAALTGAYSASKKTQGVGDNGCTPEATLYAIQEGKLVPADVTILPVKETKPGTSNPGRVPQ